MNKATLKKFIFMGNVFVVNHLPKYFPVVFPPLNKKKKKKKKTFFNYHFEN